MDATHSINVSGLTYRYEQSGSHFEALSSVNLQVREGEFVSIIGPSGCGKTTLLRVIGGLLEPTAGRVSIGSVEPKQAQREKAIGFVLQDPSLLPWRNVVDNVRLPLEVNRGRSRPGGARDLVELVGLGEFSRYYPHQLSGGMRQRVALARALVFDPGTLLMDEPLGSLDEITRAAMRYEILRIWQQTKKTVVMVTHSAAEAVAMSDRVMVMTGPPGTFIGAVDVELPRPRSAAVEHTVLFQDRIRHIQELMAMGGAFEAAAS